MGTPLKYDRMCLTGISGIITYTIKIPSPGFYDVSLPIITENTDTGVSQSYSDTNLITLAFVDNDNSVTNMVALNCSVEHCSMNMWLNASNYTVVVT